MEENMNSVADIVPIVSKITKHKLNGSNYIEWSKTIKIYLRSLAKDDHLTEEPPNDNTRKLWMQDDAQLFLQIKNSINSDIVGLLSHCEFVKELMDYPDFLYSGKGNVSRMYDVWNAFHCSEKGVKSLTAYFMDFKKVYEELNALMPFSPDVRVQQAQREQMHTNVLAAKGGNAENARRMTNRDGNRAFENRGNDSSTIECFYCHEAGHTKKNCKKLQNRNRRNQTANVATSDTATSSDSSNKIITMTAEEFAKYSQYQEALKASTLVSALAETHSAPPVTVADGSTYEIKGFGIVKPTSSITLSSVLNLPNLAFNLISDLMTKRTFGKGHVSDGLYILDEWVPRPVACVSTTSPVEAHCRLGHPSLPVLKKLCPQFDTLPSLDCIYLRRLVHSCFMKVPKQFWADAVSTACFLINRMPIVVLKGDIPYKVIHPQKSLFPIEPRIFGCTCYVRDTRPSLTKLDPKALKCVFLGYSRLQKGYRYFLTDLNKYLVSTDVVFSEDTSFFSSPTSSASEEEDEEWLVYQVVNSRPTVGQSSMVDSDVSLAHLGTVVDVPPAPVKPPIVQVYSRRPVTTDTCPTLAPSSSDPSSDLDLPISLRKASIDSISAPKTVTEALNLPGKKVVGSKWVFAVKVNLDGSVARLKARLVARGYAQTYGVDYSDTFSPVAKLNSIRLFIFIATSQQWMIHQLDIKNVFLHGDLEEEVYLGQPPRFVAQGEYGKVCCLKKALYGLKQNPRAWFGKFSKEIQAFGMNKSKKDHSVFYKKSVVGIILFVVYVDDIVITRNDHAGISDLKAFIHSKFHTKDLGELKYFLGIKVSRSKKGMFLSQRKYVFDLLEETGKIEAKPRTTPMVPNVQLMPDDGDPFYNPERYWRVVGKLNYLTVTRPDIAYSAPGLGILYNSQGHTRIECFSDADWAGSKFDRRSTTDYCVFFGGNLVAWKSKKQSVVSHSSAEFEYRAIAQATCEIIWIHQLLCEVGMKCTMLAKLWCDYQAALHIAANPIYHERTKHIEVDCYFIREKIEENLVSTGYVKTGEQLGDIFTEALNGTRVEYFCNKLVMINIYAPA
ncbi:Retrovirus-related Pol polyprotein from transposon RE1 [Vitis vinifera]|uniref:Retrovirus-related Pol polyprotein from transposon RE1 n=1 Tax=Vitis vinifera TaxID=29760 RepID=A0A438I0T1_VITVI|nr:Retrovirus-related Pol polyprotein from transposon RE1 [Vitis vinifera]